MNAEQTGLPWAKRRNPRRHDPSSRGRRSRRKGGDAERELVTILGELGLTARRGYQRIGGHLEPDLVIEELPDVWPEVKRTERLELTEALAQVARDAPHGAFPIILHRRSRTPWLAVVDARLLLDLLKRASG